MSDAFGIGRNKARLAETAARVAAAVPGDAEPLQLSLDVCNDWALRSWILSFGPLARVLTPKTLATQIKDEIDRAAERYSLE